MSYNWLPRKKLITALRIGGILMSVGVCSVMMTPSAMAAGVVTEGDHKSTAENHRPKCEGDVLPVDFSVRVQNIKLDVNSTTNKAYVDYDTETIWKRCGDNGTPRQNTRAYAVYGPKYCEQSGWYGTATNGRHTNAYDCVKFVGLPPDDYKAGSALACEKPPSPYGTSDENCLTRPYGLKIVRKDNQPATIANTTTSVFKGGGDSDGDGIDDGFYVPNWQNAKKNSGSKTFSLGTMCQYFKYGNGFDKTTNDRASWRRCANATITVKWKVETTSDPFVPVIDIDNDVVEPTDEDPYEVTGKIKYESFDTIDGQPKPQVPVTLHKAIYEPGQTPFGGGSNTAGPNAGYYGTPLLTQLGSPYSLANMTSNYTINPPIIEPFDPAYRVRNGSIICYILAVKQPPTVKTHTYNYRTQTGTDAEGDPIYSEERSATERFYSDENHDHRNNFPNPSSGGINYRAESRTWRHAVDCLVVGKRPKVQILGSDLRVRGKTVTKVTRHTAGGNSLFFGSWVEYAALTKDTDDAPASGAGYRNGTASSEAARSEWSKLTFANTPDYGGYSTLPSAPAIADYYKQQTEGKSPLAGSLASGVFRNNGPVTIVESTGLTGTTILYSEGTVTIAGNIRYKDDGYTSVDDIPQVIIVAENIKINSNVTNIDAWLIAYGDNSDTSKGNIDTCADGPVLGPLPLTRTSTTCKEPLEVNGPVVANGLYLNRTGPENSSPADPAEKFRLRPDAYIWAQARQRSTGAARTVDIVELPPRF